MWMSVGLGAGLALLYGLVSAFTYRLALHASSHQQFLAIALGGMGARMAGALVMLAALLRWVSVHDGAVVGSFFVGFLVILVGEIAWLHRRANVDLE